MNVKVAEGDVFGRLTIKVIEHSYALCRCSCGTFHRVLLKSLRSGNTKSCGCLQADEAARIGCTINKTHGMTKAREYSTWQGMRERCNDPSNKSFKDYGGRGITVCAEWSTFEQFYADMGPKPAGFSIDRRDNNGPYSKENCYWATPKEQTRNRRNTIEVEYRGEIKPLIDWCALLGCDYSTAHSRIFKHGWTVEQALTIPKCVRRPVSGLPIEEDANIEERVPA